MKYKQYNCFRCYTIFSDGRYKHIVKHKNNTILSFLTTTRYDFDDGIKVLLSKLNNDNNGQVIFLDISDVNFITIATKNRKWKLKLVDKIPVNLYNIFTK